MRLPIEDDEVEAEDVDPVHSEKSNPSPRLLLRVSEAAQTLGVSRSTVYELLYVGTLPSVKIGSCCRIRSGDLEAYVRALEAAS
jgi:excisionase family DNA binding protein